MAEFLDTITSRLQEPETQETVGKFLHVLSGLVKGKGDITVTDQGGFTFRVVDGAPQLTVSEEFMSRLGPHGLILSLDAPAINDVVARLGQVDNTVLRFFSDGETFRPEVSHTVVAKQPGHIQAFLKRQHLSGDEFQELKEFMTSHNLQFDVIDEEPEPTEDEVKDMYGGDDGETVDIQKLLRPKEEKTVSAVADKTVDVQKLLRPKVVAVKEEEDLPPVERKSRVVVPDSDDEDADLDDKPQPRKATTIHVSEDEEPAKKEEPEEEQTSKSVAIRYFKKKRDGTKDKTIGRVGDFVFRINSKMRGDREVKELICIGKYDKATRDSVDLTDSDIATVKARGYKLASKYL